MTDLVAIAESRELKEIARENLNALERKRDSAKTEHRREMTQFRIRTLGQHLADIELILEALNKRILG